MNPAKWIQEERDRIGLTSLILEIIGALSIVGVLLNWIAGG